MQRYLPEYDPEEMNAKLAGFSATELKDLLIRCYREKRVMAKMLDELYRKIRRIEDITEEPSQLLAMPGIPGPDDLCRMMK